MEADTESLRSAAPQWSLAGDRQLLGVLQNIHERLVSRCEETNRRLGDMAAVLDDATVDLHNVNNKFMALSNSQFIESRVYDDDVDVATAPEPAKEPPKLSEISEIDAIKMGLKVLEDMHEPILIMDSESESDSEDEGSRMILKPKDLYGDRPLPYIIGSYSWQSKWHAGLLPEDSDTDSSVKHEPWEREEYSESETEISKPAKEHQSTSSGELSEQATPAPSLPKSQASVAEELARRLRGELPEPTSQEDDYVTPAPQVKKVYRPEQPATSNIFSDEPPPLEQSYQSDDEENDIFAELRKNQPYAHSSRVHNVTDELFGTKRDVFSDFGLPPPHVNQKSTLFSEESEPELFAEESPPISKLDEPTDINVKKPIGGISLFGNKGTESIGAAILNRNRRRSSTDEDISEDTSQKQEKDIFDQLFAKSEKEQRKIEKEPRKVEKKIEKEVKVDKKVDLFSDNLFDDIDDIFTSNIPKVPIKAADKNQKSLFDDDDGLFSDVAVAKNSNNNVKDSKPSIFNSDLFSDKHEENVPSKEIKNIEKDNIETKIGKSIKSENKKSIFDSDDDLFPEQTNKIPDSKSKPSDISKNQTISIFDDSDSDMFTDSVETKSKHISINRTKEESSNVVKADNNKKLDGLDSNKSSLFDDDDEDLFKTESPVVSNKTNEITKTQPAENYLNVSKKQSTESIFDHKVKANKEKDSSEKPTTSLFNDDVEEELFSDKPKQLITKTDEDSKSVKAISYNDSKNDDSFKGVNTSTGLHLSSKHQILKSEIKEEIIEEVKGDIFSDLKDEVITEIKDDLLLDKNRQHVVEKYPENNSPVKSTIFDNDDIFNDSISKDRISGKIETRNRSPMFNESEDELFTNSSKNIEITKDSFKDIVEIPKLSKETEAKFEAKVSKGNSEMKGNAEIPTVLDEANDPIFDKPDVFSDIFIEPPKFEKTKEPKKSKNVNALFDDDSDDEALFFKKNDPTLDEKPEFDSPTTENRLFGIFQDEPPDLDVDFVQKSNVKVKSESTFLDSSNSTLDKIVITPENEDKPSNKDQIDSYKAPTSAKFVENDDIPKSESDKNIPKTDNLITKNDTDKIDNVSKPIGKLKNMNFNINVNALLPGASPKKSKSTEQVDVKAQTKSSEDISIKNNQEIESKMVKSISFEGKPESQVLDNTLSKDRAKIQVKRRPSTRRARQEAVRKSAINFGDDSTDNSSSIDDQPKDFKKDDISVTTEKVKVEISSRSDDNVSQQTEDKKGKSKANEETTRELNEPNKDNGININPIDKLFNNRQEVASKMESREKPISNDNQQKSVIANDDNLFSQKPEVTTKTVYILNDEDIFSVEKPKKVLNIVDDDFPSVSTLGNAYKDTQNKSNSDSEDDLFRIINTKSKTNSDDKLFKPQTKSKDEIDSDDNLFKSQTSKTDCKKSTETASDGNKNVNNTIDVNLFQPQRKATDKKVIIPNDGRTDENVFNPKSQENEKEKGIFDLSDDEDLFSTNKNVPSDDVFRKEVKKVVVKASLFGDDDEDDDLFGGSSKNTKDNSSSQATRAKEIITKSSEPVFEDPLSLLGGDDD